jgi:hypothetical protein
MARQAGTQMYVCFICETSVSQMRVASTVAAEFSHQLQTLSLYEVGAECYPRKWHWQVMYGLHQQM